ncbi:transporter [Aquitalea sp. USM4]|uniref:transporter n=1 Tax=Aquitalea sp. USM4 TaxID=1590041 RepID=UPI001F61A218|nr:transporter [Aquitalea sp. USM4]
MSVMSLSIASASYGADQVGLISGFRFLPDQAGEPIGSEQALAFLQDTSPAAEGFVWLHFNLAHVACERWIRANLALPEDFAEMLHAGAGSTRIEAVDGMLLAVINDVALGFGVVTSDVATLWVAAGSRLLVTARVRPLRSVDRLRAAVKAGEVFPSARSLLFHLMQDQADVMAAIVREYTHKVDHVEDRLLAEHLQDHRAELSSMRRTLVRMQRLLAPEPGALFRLLNRPPAWLAEPDVQALRESTEEFSLVLNDLATLVERIKLLQEELAAKLNEQTNRTLFTLTLVTVLALPINIVAGFFGMNVGGVPLANHPHGFWVLVVLVASFTLLAGWWAFRRQAPR